MRPLKRRRATPPTTALLLVFGLARLMAHDVVVRPVVDLLITTDGDR